MSSSRIPPLIGGIHLKQLSNLPGPAQIILKGFLTFLFVIFCTFGALLYSTYISSYKGENSTLVETLTDRKLTIKGKFKVSLGLKPAIAVDRVTFSNAKWESRRDMVRIKSLRAELELLPLLYGEIRIKRVVLFGADILLKTRADGLGNWVLLPTSKETEGLPILPTFDKVLIKNSVLVWRNRKTGTKNTVKFRRLRTSAASASAPLKINLRGSYNGQALRLTGNINSLASLTSNTPTSVQLKLKSGDAWLKARGQIKEPMSGANIKVSVSGRGKNLASLSGLFGTELPSIGPFELSAIVADKKSRWRLSKVKLKVGKSDLNGDIYIDPNTTPVRIFAKLNSKLSRAVDFEENGKKSISAKSKKKRKRKSRRKGDKKSIERLFPSERFSFSGLEDFSVKLYLKADKLLIDDLLFERAAVTAAISKGRLILKPAKGKFEGGRLTLSFDLKSVKRKLRVRLKADVRNMDLGKLAKRMGYPGLATGRINANTSLSGSGNSVRTIMAGLNGRFLATMKRGRINNKKITHLSGETLSAILPW